MITYTVKQNDTLWKISQEYQISLDTLLAANQQINDANYILPGMIINIPTFSVNIPEENNNENMEANYASESASLQKRPFIYTAIAGETPLQIAVTHQIPWNTFSTYNKNYAKHTPLLGDERLIIPAIVTTKRGGNYHRNRRRRRTL